MGAARRAFLVLIFLAASVSAEVSSTTAAACRAGCSMETVLADDTLKLWLFPDIVLLQVCLATAQGKPDACDSLADMQGDPETGQRMCRRLYLMGLFSKSLFSGKNVAAACADWCRMAPTVPPEDLIGRVCEALGRKDYPRACSDIGKWKTTPDHVYDRRKCDAEMLSLLGEAGEEVCGRNYRPGSDVCLATAAYRKAKAASDPARCGGRPLCRALLGEGPGACAALEATILDQARAMVSPPAPVPPKN